MSRSIQYATRRYTIPANASIETVRDSRLLTCLEASGPFLIRFDDGPENEFAAGLTYLPDGGFSRVAMRNETAVDIAVWLAFGKGEIIDSRVVIGNQMLRVREASPDQFNTKTVNCADGAATNIFPSDETRSEVILTTPPSAAGVVYVNRNSGAPAGAGLPLWPGQSVVLKTSDTIHVRNDTGAAVDVYAAQTRWTS